MTKRLSDGDVRERLWKAIEDHHVGMLGLAGDGREFQPMTAFVEPDANRIWFFTRDDTDLARDVADQGGADATFIFQERKLHASIVGRIARDHDRERIERYWNAHVAAWYPDGKDDPALTLLRLDVDEAAVWITEAGPLKYAFELAKANASNATPELGERRDLDLH